MPASGKIGVLVVLHNVTELKKLEKVRRDFVANVSHELRTPVTSIKGFVETLLDGAMHNPDGAAAFSPNRRRADRPAERDHRGPADARRASSRTRSGPRSPLTPARSAAVLEAAVEAAS